MKIWANTIVQNEERYVWFAVKSIIDFIDRIIIRDAGSTDKTFEILKLLKKEYPEKIDLAEVGEVDIHKYTKVRQEMLDKTDSDWFIVLDGDEVWWSDSIKNVVSEINKNGDKLDSLVNRYFNLVGDIFHYQEEKAGMYQIDNMRGHLTIRAMNRKIPGLHQDKPHGTHGFFDKNGVLVQELVKERRLYLDAPYMHFTNMIRSGNLQGDKKVPKRGFKYKHELGLSFPLDFYYPEVFFIARPEIVPTPWRRMSNRFRYRAIIETPLRKTKRRVLKSRTGY